MELKNFEKLAESITSKILEKLELKNDINPSDKSCLLLVQSPGFGVNDYYRYIDKEFPGYNLYVGKDKLLSGSKYRNNNLFKVIDIDFNSEKFTSILEHVERIIVAGLKISQMKRLIDTDDNNDINHIILGSLMANKPVTIILNTNESMYRKISSVIADLKEMGIQVVNIQRPTLNDIPLLKQNDLITEDFVSKFGKKGKREITLHEKQLITPLAKDKLRELKIDIKYVKEDK